MTPRRSSGTNNIILRVRLEVMARLRKHGVTGLEVHRLGTRMAMILDQDFDLSSS